MDKIPLSVVTEWLSQPVTVAYLEGLKRTRQDAIELLANKGCFSTTDSVENLYSSFMGQLHALEVASDPKTLMIYHDLVEEPKEPKDDKEGK